MQWGRRVPEVIGTPERLKAKLELVEALGDIEVAMKLLKSSGGEDGDEVHPIDRHYQQLKCQITPLDPSGETMKLIKVSFPSCFVRSSDLPLHRILTFLVSASC